MLKPTDPRFLDQDPCTIFLYGGCHAFAAELGAQLAAAGTVPEFYCLRSVDAPTSVHVIVRIGADYYDALGGPQSEATLRERFVHRRVGAPELVSDPTRLTTGANPTATVSGYWSYIGPGFVDAVRAKARAYISSRPERFGLPPRLQKSSKGAAKTKRPIVDSKLSDVEQNEWLKQHLPHRIRSVLPGLRYMDKRWDIASPEVTDYATRSLTDSVNEGRHSGMRWLVFFVGIMMNRDEQPVKTKYTTDETYVWIERIEGGVPFDVTKPEAVELARLYLGCTQATGHPTRATNHPPIREQELARGMKIILRHLQDTIYKKKGLDLEKLTLRKADSP